MKAESDPSHGCIGARCSELDIIAQVKGEFDALHRTFDSHTRYFAIALQRMSITCREQRSRNGYRKKECATCNKFLAVYITSTKARRECCKQAGLIRWHAHDTHKWTKRERSPVLIPASHCSSVQGPYEFFALLRQAKALIQLALHTPANRPSPCSRSYLVDLHFEGHARLGSTNGHGSAQGMAVITLFEARPKFTRFLFFCCSKRFQVPAGVKRTETYRVARIDR